MATRRKFIWQSTALAIGASLMGCMRASSSGYVLRDADTDAALGHRLRDGQFPEPSMEYRVNTVIIGAGVSGLSAARALSKNGVDDYCILELSKRVGGQSASSMLAGLACPLGAHYLPIINLDNSALYDFLEESGIIIGKDRQGLPIYNERDLVHAPDERLYIKGQWVEGLIPAKFLAAPDRGEFQRFFEAMEEFRQYKGHDGLYFFDLPMRKCSVDTTWDCLDTVTLEQWMHNQGYHSTYLHWYTDYACRDDFGAGANEVSAWAGVHYFASRKGKAANAESSDVLTWPEGNAFLVEQLCLQMNNQVQHEQLVYEIRKKGGDFDVLVFDGPNNRSVRYLCHSVIGALPLYLARRFKIYENATLPPLHYAPWLVANIHYQDLDGELFEHNLHWDNVLFESKGLGYIQSTHQNLKGHSDVGVLTYYWAMNGDDERGTRALMREKSLEHWATEIMNDLGRAHPNLRDKIDTIEIKIWGHAMLKPVCTSMRGPLAWQRAQSPVEGYFPAHSDCGGMSLFEEAFDRGSHAAAANLEYLKNRRS